MLTITCGMWVFKKKLNSTLNYCLEKLDRLEIYSNYKMSGVQNSYHCFWLVKFFWRCSSICILTCIINEEMLVYLPFVLIFIRKKEACIFYQYIY